MHALKEENTHGQLSKGKRTRSDNFFQNPKFFYRNLKQQWYQIVVTSLEKDSIDFRKVDYTKPTLIVVWNELDWISEESRKYADYKVIIPMYWMVQSLNVSVATAVILYEAQRQREEAWFYSKPTFPQNLIDEILKKWAYYDIINKNWRKYGNKRY